MRILSNSNHIVQIIISSKLCKIILFSIYLFLSMECRSSFLSPAHSHTLKRYGLAEVTSVSFSLIFVTMKALVAITHKQKTINLTENISFETHKNDSADFSCHRTIQQEGKYKRLVEFGLYSSREEFIFQLPAQSDKNGMGYSRVGLQFRQCCWC